MLAATWSALSSQNTAATEPVESPRSIRRTFPSLPSRRWKVFAGKTWITLAVTETSLRPEVRSPILSFASMRSPAPSSPRFDATRWAAASSVSSPAAFARSSSMSLSTASLVRLGFRARIRLMMSSLLDMKTLNLTVRDPLKMDSLSLGFLFGGEEVEEGHPEGDDGEDYRQLVEEVEEAVEAHFGDDLSRGGYLNYGLSADPTPRPAPSRASATRP